MLLASSENPHFLPLGRPSKVPEMGRTVPELPGTGLREIIEGRYRIVYRIKAKGIQIITVFEGHRQFPAEDVVE
jgi:plasmid stabilization system protein ParE